MCRIDDNEHLLTESSETGYLQINFGVQQVF